MSCFAICGSTADTNQLRTSAEGVCCPSTNKLEDWLGAGKGTSCQKTCSTGVVGGVHGANNFQAQLGILEEQRNREAPADVLFCHFPNGHNREPEPRDLSSDVCPCPTGVLAAALLSPLATQLIFSAALFHNAFAAKLRHMRHSRNPGNMRLVTKVCNVSNVASIGKSTKPPLVTRFYCIGNKVPPLASQPSAQQRSTAVAVHCPPTGVSKVALSLTAMLLYVTRHLSRDK